MSRFFMRPEWKYSCDPNCTIELVQYEDGTKNPHLVPINGYLGNGIMPTVPFSNDSNKSNAPLKCWKHKDTICPKEQQRLQFQLRVTDETKWARSCQPNCDVIETIQPDGSIQKRAVPKKELSDEEFPITPFEKDSKKSEAPLECWKHKDNIDLCPKEKERKQFNAQRAKMQKAQAKQKEKK